MKKRMRTSRAAAAIAVVVAVGGVAIARETTRVSVDSSGAEANDQSPYWSATSISADGRVVAFDSLATNLVGGDANGVADVFVHDRATGTTERVSVDSLGAEANGGSINPSLSSDGECVAFVSSATNLVVGDTNGHADVFVHDRSTGTTEIISVDSSGVPGNGDSSWPSLSADGHVVVFESYASNLVVGDANGQEDVFVHDRTTGVTERVSVTPAGKGGNGQSESGVALSADGQVVAFASSASNLVSGDGNNARDIFVRDRSSGITERVSVDSSGVEGDAASWFPAISADGRCVAFTSSATNLVVGDSNGQWDDFVHDRVTGATERVSVASSGAQGDGTNDFPSLSSDGRYVAFVSSSTNLVAGDTNNYTDVFVHDRTDGRTDRVSVDSTGLEASSGSWLQSISSDGHVVAFGSFAPNLVGGDANGVGDVFVHERCQVDASWANYGAGFGGTNGVPAFTAESNPVVGAPLTLDLANSYGKFTAGLLFVGFQQTSLTSSWGGDLLVVPFLTSGFVLPSAGTTFTGVILDDEALCGLEVDLQAIEADPGAAKGVSFTPGLELVLGF